MKYYPDINSVSLTKIERYLQSRGWKKRKDFPSKKLLVYDGPQDLSGEVIQAVIPSSEEFKDYPLRITELIDSLSQLEERAIQNILEDITHPNTDKLQIRVLSSISEDGTLPVGYTVQLVNGLKELLVSAACVEENPQPYYKRATKASIDYAENCRFGQTKVGSFVVTVESILPSVQATMPIDGISDESFNRRVIKRIQKGMSLVEQSIEQEDISILTDHYKEGLNANMCEAILSLEGEASDINLEYSVDWSLSEPIKDNIPITAKIEKTGFSYLKEAAIQMRGSLEVVNKEIIGKVIRLSAPDIDEEDISDDNRVITVKTESYRVTVPLTILEYREACDAHRDNKNIKVTGHLERVGNRWQLIDPQGFSIV